MNEAQNHQQESSEITKNVLDKNNFMGFQKRNWIEGVIAASAATYLIRLIPFVSSLKSVVSVITFSTILFVTLVGIKSRSLTQVLVAEYKFKKNRRKLHLRSCEYVRERTLDKGNYEEQSYAGRIYKTINKKIDRFITAYHQDPDSK